MDNWSRGWRKFVEWDNDNKVYIYKGHEIFPLSYKEMITMPTHLQNEHYWGEIAHIDGIVNDRIVNERTPNANGQKELEEAMNMFWESVGM